MATLSQGNIKNQSRGTPPKDSFQNSVKLLASCSLPPSDEHHFENFYKRRTSELYLIHISFNDLLFSIGLLPQVAMKFWLQNLIAKIQVFTRSTKIQMGDNGCKIMLGMTYLNMYASIFFVTIMTVDRYIAVVFGPNNSSFRKWRSRSSIQFQGKWLFQAIQGSNCWQESRSRMTFYWVNAS